VTPVIYVNYCIWKRGEWKFR